MEASTSIVSADVKKTAESFLNAWKMGYLYKIFNATSHEVQTAIKQGTISKELYEDTKLKASALRYLASTCKTEPLRHKANNNAAELEAYLKKMEVITSSKA